MAFLTASFHFPRSWTQVIQFLTLIWQMSCLTLSSHLYLGLPCDLLVRGFHLNIFLTWSAHQPVHTLKLFTLKFLKMLRHVSIIRSTSGSCLFLAKITLLKTFTLFNNVILASSRQLPDDDRMTETCRSVFKSFNVNNLSVCIGWCADQVTLRSARCNGKDDLLICSGTWHSLYVTKPGAKWPSTLKLLEKSVLR